MSEPVEQPVDEGLEQAAETESTALSPDEQLAKLEALAAERTEDLQRLQAEYVNYKKRVDRDRSLARQSGIEAVLRDLMPVFDSILAAKEHDDLTGGFKLTADELDKVTQSYGFSHYGVVGDEFDPLFHEALMQESVPGDGPMRLKDILQVGYRIADQVLRPARVVVAVPDGSPVEPAENGDDIETDTDTSESN